MVGAAGFDPTTPCPPDYLTRVSGHFRQVHIVTICLRRRGFCCSGLFTGVQAISVFCTPIAPQRAPCRADRERDRRRCHAAAAQSAKSRSRRNMGRQDTGPVSARWRRHLVLALPATQWWQSPARQSWRLAGGRIGRRPRARQPAASRCR